MTGQLLTNDANSEKRISIMTLTLDQAVTIVRTVHEVGKSRGMAPLCAVVLDTGGHALALMRDERASNGRPDVATAKAAGCLSMGFGGREIARRAKTAPEFYAALNARFAKGLLPVAGGVLIRDAGGQLLGAVGVTGDTSDNDEVCALAGIAAAGLVAEAGA
jgi:uncharacterized protein GlcG (DUF336 family)